MARKHRPGCRCCPAAPACHIRVRVRNACEVPLSGATVVIRNGLDTATLGTATTDAAGVADVQLLANPGFLGYVVRITRTGYAERIQGYASVSGSCTGGARLATVDLYMRPAPGLAVVQCEEPVSTGATFNAAYARVGGGGCQSYSFSGALSYLSSDAEGVGTWQGCLASDADLWLFACDQTYGPCGLGPLSIPARFFCSALQIKILTASDYCAGLDPITGQPTVDPVIRCAVRACPCDPDAGFYSGLGWSGLALAVASCAPFAASASAAGSYWEVAG